MMDSSTKPIRINAYDSSGSEDSGQARSTIICGMACYHRQSLGNRLANQVIHSHILVYSELLLS